MRRLMSELKVPFRTRLQVIDVVCLDDCALRDGNLYHSHSRIRHTRHPRYSTPSSYALPFAFTVRGQSLIASAASLA